MNHKLKVSTLLWLIYILILLIDIRFFYYKNFNHILELLLSIMMIGIMYIGTPGRLRQIGNEMPFIRRICFTTIISFMIVYAYSIFEYREQGLYNTFTGESSNYKMLLIVLVYPIAYFLMHFGIKKVFRAFNIIAGITYTVSILQFVLFNLTGRILLPAISISGDPYLYGTLRIALSWIGNIMLLYNFYMFFVQKPGNRRSKFKYFTLFVLGFADCVVISRVRGALGILVVCLIINVFMNKNTTASLFKKAAFIIGICAFAYFTDYLSDFFDTFSLTATRAYSTTARLYAMNYYWDYFIEHPLFGFGFADGVKNYALVHGDGRADISDIGFFGQIVKYGVLIIPIYVYPLIRAFVVLLKARKNHNIKDNSFYFSLACFVLGTSYSLIAIDHFRMLLWPFFIAVIEYVNYINESKSIVLEL